LAVFASNDGIKSNAGQHMAWSGLSYKNLILAGFSKPEALLIDFNFLTIHEWCSDSEIDTQMDHHNNGYGRKWVHENTTWGIWFLRRLPSDYEIISEMSNVVNSSNRIYKYPDEISIGNWTNLVPTYNYAVYVR
jgi:hypothetical protein